MNKALGKFVVAILCSWHVHANAVDGCTVLLCLAGNWSKIQECVPPVTEALNDLAQGDAFPECEMSGPGNSAGNTYVTEPLCPLMYSEYDADKGSWVSCYYTGLIAVFIDGELWSEVFWNGRGETSTRYSATAKENLGEGSYDTKYDDDQAAWDLAHPPTPPDDGGGRGS